MAELTPQERLQPALLDRLRDDDPGNPQERRDQRVLSKQRLREAVLRDLTWLFNATRMEASVDLSRAPRVRHSVVNFGLPALSGRPASSLDIIALERSVREAIVDFEPRIIPSTLEVKALRQLNPGRVANVPSHLDVSRTDHNVIGVEIRGQLWAQPVPLELLVRTEIDLETGAVEVRDLMPGRTA